MYLPQLLHMHDLPITLPATMRHSLPERVRLRLKEEIERKHLSQRELSQLLNKPEDQPRISRILTGKQTMTVDDLEELCFALSLSPTEAVRDHGLEFVADLTPTELRVLEELRAVSPALREAILTMLDIKAKGGALPQRYASPLKKPRLNRGRS